MIFISLWVTVITVKIRTQDIAITDLTVHDGKVKRILFHSQ
jgi:hypothetical protein